MDWVPWRSCSRARDCSRVASPRSPFTQGAFSIFHRALGAIELAWRLHAKAAETLAQLVETVAEFALALAKAVR